MFGLGAPELILILGIILIIFGAGKLPSVGSALGKSIREFRSASDEHVTPTAVVVPTTPASTVTVASTNNETAA